MSMACEELAERIRPLLPHRANIRETRMFGGIAFMVNGNMAVCPTKEGALIVRVGKDGMDEALGQPGASRMDMGGRSMGGFVVIAGDALEDDDALADWIGRASSFVTTLPSK